ncbi:MAG TPA: cell division protein ZapA [Polyangia bacterium]
MKQRPVTVVIAGQKYTLRSDADDATVRALAAFVDAKFREVQKQSRAADTQALAILTAMRIAEDLFGERAATKKLKKQIREKGQALLQFLAREAGV